MSEARSQILERIRSANAAAGALASPLPNVDRSYRQRSPREESALLAQLEDRLLDYTATVTHTTASDVRSALSSLLQANALHRIAIPTGTALTGSLPEGFEFVVDEVLTSLELDGVDAVLTGCTCAIAETGTIVLQGGPEAGRRALTLVPDVHICLVRSSDVLATVPEAIARIASSATLPTTFVSGPSATADIEMTRVKGVHGPRFLHVLLVHDPQ